jgi:hypothetical protein
MVNPHVYLRALDQVVADMCCTNLRISPDDPYDPRDDEPYRIIDRCQIPIFDKYRLPSATAELARAAVAYRWPVPLRHH